jgi:hypothetical protein
MPQPLVARALAVSGVVIIVVALVLAATVNPIAGFAALLGVIDLGLAWAFASGRFGGSAEVDNEAAPPDPAEDPSYNPYARED